MNLFGRMYRRVVFVLSRKRFDCTEGKDSSGSSIWTVSCHGGVGLAMDAVLTLDSDRTHAVAGFFFAACL